MSTTHRSTSQYKIKNKPFKGRGNHKSKGAVRRLAAGKVEKEEKRSVKVKSQEGMKANSRNKKRQLMQQQREKEREMRRRGMAPRLVLIVQMSPSADAHRVKNALAKHCGPHGDGAGPVTVTPPKLRRKEKFTLVAVSAADVFEALEGALVADLLVPVVDAREGVAEEGVRLASAIKAQGLPATLPVVSGMQRVAPEERAAARKGLLADLQYLFPSAARVLPVDEGAEDLHQVFRFLQETRLHELHYRKPRALLVAEHVAFAEQPAADPAQLGPEAVEEPERWGLLRVTGYMRGGNGFSPDQLVHVPGLGSLQVERVLDPDNGGAELCRATEARPSLQSENDPDPFAGGEQTWPTDADVAMAGMSDDEEYDEEGEDGVQIKTVRKRRVPAGLSEYQAAWLVDSQEEDDEDVEEDEQDGAMELSSEERRAVEDDEEGAAALDLMSEDDDEEEEAQRRKRELEADEQRWPDEVDVGFDVLARERFQKYRGLESFRTSAWDPKENLPVDYSRIFQLENFPHFVRRHTRTHIDTVSVGTHVTLELRCPVELALQLRPNRLLILGSLGKHEHRTSVLHFDVMKHPEFQEPLASKEELVAFFGLHRLAVTPIFSQHVPGCDRCKYERFLPASGATMASFYGPITYTPCSITLFKVVDGAPPVLVGSGTLRTVDADILLIKKIILTAHPAKIHKRSAMCRGMFHNPEDVKWFKPIALWTKEGRLGHIRESNGTKGAFKGVFDGIISNADTVCMSLYKRVFPKWQFDNYLGYNKQ